MASLSIRGTRRLGGAAEGLALEITASEHHSLAWGAAGGVCLSGARIPGGTTAAGGIPCAPRKGADGSTFIGAANGACARLSIRARAQRDGHAGDFGGEGLRSTHVVRHR
jgi:hypothetical protein